MSFLNCKIFILEIFELKSKFTLVLKQKNINVHSLQDLDNLMTTTVASAYKFLLTNMESLWILLKSESDFMYYKLQQGEYFTLIIDVEDDNMARPLVSVFSLELSSCCLSALFKT